MKNTNKNEWQYQGAFVIQFRPDTDLQEGRCSGRVEHVASYEAAHFHSLDEVLAFVSRVLTQVRVERQEELSETLSVSEDCNAKPARAE